jgi:hypothetical protein
MLNRAAVVGEAVTLRAKPFDRDWPSANRFHRPVARFDAGMMVVPPLSGSKDEASQKKSPPPSSPQV